MKKIKKSLLILFGATSCYIVICAYYQGAAAFGGYECTGAETGDGNPAGCGIGGSCHASSATPGIAVTLELDSAGTPTTHYTGGMTYTVKFTGTNNTSSILPKFGFQLGSIQGSVAQTTPTNAGTWPSPYPPSTTYAAPFNSTYYVVGVVEQTIQISSTSGGGGNGTVYSETFNWVAPAKGTGTISFWGALNAVNNNNVQDGGDLWNTIHIVVNEWAPNAVAPLEQNALNLNIFPNPVTNYATLDYTLKENDNVQVELYGISGKKICALFCKEQSAGIHSQMLQIPTITSGIYLLQINAGKQVSYKRIIRE